MSGGLVLAMTVLGGFGAITRFRLDAAITARAGSRFPVGTLGINITGSFLLGLLAAAVATGADPGWLLVLGTGFCGGFTTFSTASVDSVRLARAGRIGAALVNAVGSLLLCTAAAAAGFALLG